MSTPITGVTYSNLFQKNFKKRIAPNPKLTKKYKERLSLFLTNRSDNILHDHSLQPFSKGFRSFSITGDIRVIYKEEPGVFVFLNIGTHAQVYGM